MNFVSDILGLNSEYQDALRTWLEPYTVLNTRWHICYRATDHGFGAQAFHEKCDNTGEIGATVTLVKVGRYVFGGFSDQIWGGKYPLRGRRSGRVGYKEGGWEMKKNEMFAQRRDSTGNIESRYLRWAILG